MDKLDEKELVIVHEWSVHCGACRPVTRSGRVMPRLTFWKHVCGDDNADAGAKSSNQRTLTLTGPVAATIQMETQLCLSASGAERNPWGGVSKGAQWEERSANEGIYC